ncbi:MAG TPA: hypothetical protein VF203_03970 [Burkholderiales bacterium]
MAREPIVEHAQALAPGPCNGADAIAQALAALAASARRELRLHAPRLDDVIVGNSVVVDALRRFATRHARNRVRILLEETASLLQDHDRLIALARRLPEAIQFREVEENDRGARDLYAVADRSACLLQEDVGRYRAVVAADSPRQNAQRVERFDELWDRATPVALWSLGL